ncbi:cupin domain-containing protein [Ignavibacterium sp.]|uniref:cupin domain-containing protein n=1 Tax=Ignavibacterium sp. TaxID=2651167 RepID=UPI0021FBFEB5|nr:cupin domain-containing protein [Ignavibacterium sp.]BDQ02224.1 MAG: cupin [Ignavibacterium sp.]
MNLKNFFSNIPDKLSDEIIETVFKSDSIRIERIISQGQSSPENFWYNQPENEWVIVLEGKAMIRFEDKSIVTLHKGDYLFIPAFTKHRVEWTDPNQLTIWLAIFFK